jgi:hypothetical protein
MEANLFDPNRSMTPYFQLGGLSPPPRQLPADGPTYFPNIFNQHGRAHAQHKDQMQHNPFMLSSRAQNGFGLNFQHGFGMNPAMHPNHSAASASAAHSNSVSVTPHMPNFNLNLFDSQGDAGLNISPIKFPHGNGLLHQGAMHDAAQHSAHQASMYNGRAAQMPPPMLANPIFGHQHPGFEMPRGPSISSAMSSAAPYAHAPFGGVPLNFPMHEH